MSTIKECKGVLIFFGLIAVVNCLLMFGFSPKQNDNQVKNQENIKLNA